MSKFDRGRRFSPPVVTFHHIHFVFRLFHVLTFLFVSMWSRFCSLMFRIVLMLSLPLVILKKKRTPLSCVSEVTS